MSKNEIREIRRASSNRRRQLRRVVLTVAGGGLALALIAGLVVTPFLVRTEEVLNFNEGGDTPLDPDAGAFEVSIGSNPRYQVWPPSSGPYWSSSNETVDFAGEKINVPLEWGEYDFVVPDGAVLNNLHMGGIILYYDCEQNDDIATSNSTVVTTTPEACEQEIETLRREYLGLRQIGLLLAPRPEVVANSPKGENMVIVGWRHRQFIGDLSGGGLDTIRRFVDQYHNRGLRPLT